MASVYTIPYRPRKIFLDVHKQLSSHRFNCIVAHRRAGKTVALINQTIKKAIECPLKNPQYAIVGPQLKQIKLIAWRYLKDFTRVLPGFKANEAELFVEFFAGTGNGARRIYLCGADNPDSLRGAYWDGVILDEYAQIKPELWEEIILPSITDRNGWVIFSGTPKGMNHFYDVFLKAQQKAKEPNSDWWCGFYPADVTGVIPEETLNLIRTNMSESKFRQEFLCDFAASNDNVLIPIDLAKQALGKLHEYHIYSDSAKVLGVDVARFGDDFSVIQSRQGLQAFEPVKLSKIDNMGLATIIANTITRHSIQTVFIDAGRGEGVIDRLRQLGFKNIIEVPFGGRAPAPGYANMRTYMWDSVKKWLEQGGALPNNIELFNDLVTPLYSINLQDKMVLETKDKIKERIGRSPDLGDALALTFAYPVVSKRVAGYLRDMDNRYFAKQYNPVNGFLQQGV